MVLPVICSFQGLVFIGTDKVDIHRPYDIDFVLVVKGENFRFGASKGQNSPPQGPIVPGHCQDM